MDKFVLYNPVLIPEVVGPPTKLLATTESSRSAILHLFDGVHGEKALLGGLKVLALNAF